MKAAVILFIGLLVVASQVDNALNQPQAPPQIPLPIKKSNSKLPQTAQTNHIPKASQQRVNIVEKKKKQLAKGEASKKQQQQTAKKQKGGVVPQKKSEHARTQHKKTQEKVNVHQKKEKSTKAPAKSENKKTAEQKTKSAKKSEKSEIVTSEAQRLKATTVKDEVKKVAAPPKPDISIFSRAKSLEAQNSELTHFKSAVIDVLNISIEAKKTSSYLIRNLNTTKALMVSVAPNLQRRTPVISGFEVMISGQGMANKVICNFAYLTHLCVVERPPTQVNIELSCGGQKCQQGLVLSQRALIDTGLADKPYTHHLKQPGAILKLQERPYNSIMQIFSDIDHSLEANRRIVVYSNVHIFTLERIQQLSGNAAIFGIKPIKSANQRYICIDSPAEAKFRVSIRTHASQLKEGVPVVDFLENFGHHSASTYTYADTITKNLQLNLRIFAPKDSRELPLLVSILGKNVTEQQAVRLGVLKLSGVDFRGQRFDDIVFALPASQLQGCKMIQVQFQLGQVENQAVFFEASVRDIEVFQINIFDEVIFGASQGEQVHFHVEPQVKLELEGGDKKIPIRTRQSEGVTSSLSDCSLSKGCEFKVQASRSRCEQCGFDFDLGDQKVRNHILFYTVDSDTIQGKVQEGEELFFRYHIPAKAHVQLIVNSMNAIIYSSFEEDPRCPLPTANCHQYAATQQAPVMISNWQQKTVELNVGVVGLEQTSFKVRFLPNQPESVKVDMGEKFVYLFDKTESDLPLKYHLEEEDWPDSALQLYFNLIAPANSLVLHVENAESQVSYSSNEGYITFGRREIQGPDFKITITKTSNFLSSTLHMTLIISSSLQPVQLDSTTTHYEIYEPNQSHKFLMDYSSEAANAINIFTEGLQKTQGTMTVSFRDLSDTKNSEALLVRELKRDSELINLDDEWEYDEICEDVNCQLEITVSFKGSQRVEQSLTLLTRDSIISLDDSIWSVFEVNPMSLSNHFYFIPRTEQNDITILFHTEDSHIFITHRIFNTKNSPNPQDWPFQQAKNCTIMSSSDTQQISISKDDPQIKECRPHCVVLININQSHREDQKPEIQHAAIKNYKIMATNSVFELPEDTKLSFALQTGLEKTMFIAVKNFLKVPSLTFFTYFSLGRARISAQLISNGHSYSLHPNKKQLIFGHLETSIPMYLINNILEENRLKPDEVMLEINIKALTGLKMTLEFTSYTRDIYRLGLDQLQMTYLEQGQQVWYQFIPERDFLLKLNRHKGFPFFKIFQCKEDDYIECLAKERNYLQVQKEQQLQVQESVKQQSDAKNAVKSGQKHPIVVFMQKSYQFGHEECQKCLFILWVYCFEGPLEMSVNLRTSSREIELKEMTALNEQIKPGKHNKYLMNVYPDKQAILTIRVTEGAASIIIKDSQRELYNDKLSKDDKDYEHYNIQTVLRPEQDDQEELAVAGLRSNNGDGIFKPIHVEVKTTSEIPVVFFISYSIGQSKVYLQDGIVEQRELNPGEPQTFFYANNDMKSHAYLTLSYEPIQSTAATTGEAQYFQIRFYYYPNIQNLNEREQFHPSKPPKRNQNYLGSTASHVYQLPASFHLFEVEVQASIPMRMTASINHKELIYLPLGYEYLIKLHQKQALHLVVDRPPQEYLEVVVKKCDSSMPTLYYTNDADEFKKGRFTASADIDSYRFRHFLQTKPTSKTLHLKLKADPTEQTLLTVVVKGIDELQKHSAIKYRPGGKGVVSYRMLHSSKVEVAFKPLTCDGQQCNAPVEYFLVTAPSLQQVYGEMNCAGSYFIGQNNQSHPPNAQVERVPADKLDKASGYYRYEIPLSENGIFVGVRAVLSGGVEEDINYLPTEVTTGWESLSKVSFGVVLMGAVGLSVFITIVIVVSTKLARRGYRPISMQE